jgi:hypothetical protein
MPEIRENFTEEPYFPPAGLDAEAVARVWAAVLGVDRVGGRDSFYDFAGTSMNAVAICARLKHDLALTAELETVYERPVLDDFVAALNRP